MRTMTTFYLIIYVRRFLSQFRVVEAHYVILVQKRRSFFVQAEARITVKRVYECYSCTSLIPTENIGI